MHQLSEQSAENAVGFGKQGSPWSSIKSKLNWTIGQSNIQFPYPQTFSSTTLTLIERDSNQFNQTRQWKQQQQKQMILQHLPTDYPNQRCSTSPYFGKGAQWIKWIWVQVLEVSISRIPDDWSDLVQPDLVQDGSQQHWMSGEGAMQLGKQPNQGGQKWVGHPNR